MILQPIKMNVAKCWAKEHGWTHTKREYEPSNYARYLIVRGYYAYDENDDRHWVPEERTVVEGEYVDYYSKGNFSCCSVATCLPPLDD